MERRRTHASMEPRIISSSMTSAVVGATVVAVAIRTDWPARHSSQRIAGPRIPHNRFFAGLIKPHSALHRLLECTEHLAGSPLRKDGFLPLETRLSSSPGQPSREIVSRRKHELLKIAFWGEPGTLTDRRVGECMIKPDSSQRGRRPMSVFHRSVLRSRLTGLSGPGPTGSCAYTPSRQCAANGMSWYGDAANNERLCPEKP